jgi:hypothetical protein
MVDPVPILATQLALLAERCPVLCPSIFTSQFKPSSLGDLCSDESQAKKLKKLLLKSGDGRDLSQNIVFPVMIDLNKKQIVVSAVKFVDDVDVVLYSLERMLTSMITGQPDTLNMLVQRFMEVNNHADLSLVEGRRLMYEAYHLAYSVKIALK